MSIRQSKINFECIASRPKEVTSEVIHIVCKRLINNINPTKIVLFGSQVKSNPKKDSDIDLLIIIDSKNPVAKLKRRDRFSQIVRLFPHKGFGMDVIVLTENEVQRIVDENEGEWDLILEILKEGKTIYEQNSKNK